MLLWASRSRCARFLDGCYTGSLRRNDFKIQCTSNIKRLILLEGSKPFTLRGYMIVMLKTFRGGAIDARRRLHDPKAPGKVLLGSFECNLRYANGWPSMADTTMRPMIVDE